MPETRRSDEPFCEPSVDASTEAEGRHSISVYRNQMYTSLYIVYTHVNVPLFALCPLPKCHQQQVLQFTSIDTSM